jgi:hypothetical protein
MPAALETFICGHWETWESADRLIKGSPIGIFDFGEDALVSCIAAEGGQKLLRAVSK